MSCGTWRWGPRPRTVLEAFPRRPVRERNPPRREGRARARLGTAAHTTGEHQPLHVFAGVGAADIRGRLGRPRGVGAGNDAAQPAASSSLQTLDSPGATSPALLSTRRSTSSHPTFSGRSARGNGLPQEPFPCGPPGRAIPGERGTGWQVVRRVESGVDRLPRPGHRCRDCRCAAFAPSPAAADVPGYRQG